MTDNWLIAIHADACPFVEEGRAEQLPACSCLLLAEPNDLCNVENCPRRLMIGDETLGDETLVDTVLP